MYEILPQAVRGNCSFGPAPNYDTLEPYNMPSTGNMRLNCQFKNLNLVVKTSHSHQSCAKMRQLLGAWTLRE